MKDQAYAAALAADFAKVVERAVQAAYDRGYADCLRALGGTLRELRKMGDTKCDPAVVDRVIPKDPKTGNRDPQGSPVITSDHQRTPVIMADAATLPPLAPAEAKVFRVLVAHLPNDARVPTGKNATDFVPGVKAASVSAYLSVLSSKGYIRRIGCAQYELLAIGEPRLTKGGPGGRQAGTKVVDGRLVYPDQPSFPRGRPDVARPITAKRQPQRRFTDLKVPDPASVRVLDRYDPALREMRTLFPGTVVDPKDSPRLLVSGKNSRKLGDRINKGAWAGMPIYQLTLEERATCPTTCELLASCYGNAMHLARRHRFTPDLQRLLLAELVQLAKAHSSGFAVRLHTLGDFPTFEYVDFWRRVLTTVPQLRVFGYTHWPRDSEIGAAIAAITEKHWDRFAIRFSSDVPLHGGTVTIWRKPESRVVAEGIVCPAETGQTACCGSCALCWAPAARRKCIVFIGHGNAYTGRNGKKPEPVITAKSPSVQSSLSAAAKAMLAKPAPAPCPNPVKITTPVVRRVDEHGREIVPDSARRDLPIPAQIAAKPPQNGARDLPTPLPDSAIPDGAATEIVAAADRQRTEPVVYVTASEQPSVGAAHFRERRTGQNERPGGCDPEPGHSASDAADFNAKSYLIKKGYTVAIAVGGLRVNGRFYNDEQLLALVNEHRAKADLPPLSRVTNG